MKHRLLAFASIGMAVALSLSVAVASAANDRAADTPHQRLPALIAPMDITKNSPTLHQSGLVALAVAPDNDNASLVYYIVDKQTPADFAMARNIAYVTYGANAQNAGTDFVPTGRRLSIQI